MSVRELEPQSLWNHFEDLNAVPRASKKEERVIAFMQDFGKVLNLETYTDPVGNVIIKKPATTGMEGRQTVIIQSHLDMVHQKNNETEFDFDTQGIQTYIDGDWVKARGTTLGADNGLGVAAIMALLSSTEISHPALEALFTIDEETGMTGAFELEKGKLDGTILLNLDTEDDDEFSIGCAGGIDTNTSYHCHYQPVPPQASAYELKVTGLKGGHSGVDINNERGNANKIMNRLMYKTEAFGLRIVSIDGGSLRNAIPRESVAQVIVTDETYTQEFEIRNQAILDQVKDEDPNCTITLTKKDKVPETAASLEDTIKITTAIQACYNGVFKMSRSIDNLVETSTSLARVMVKDGEFTTQSLQRSSLEAGKMNVADTVGAAFKLMGCDVQNSGSYPGWAPNPNSRILNVLVDKYKTMFDDEPKVMAIHAGLECGILGERYPGLDMISFGPTIKGAHSPDERVSISSVKKFWKFLLAVLKDTPKK